MNILYLLWEMKKNNQKYFIYITYSAIQYIQCMFSLCATPDNAFSARNKSASTFRSLSNIKFIFLGVLFRYLSGLDCHRVSVHLTGCHFIEKNSIALKIKQFASSIVLIIKRWYWYVRWFSIRVAGRKIWCLRERERERENSILPYFIWTSVMAFEDGR